MRSNTIFLPSRRNAAAILVVAVLAILPAATATAQIKQVIDNLASKFSASEPDLMVGASARKAAADKDSASLPMENREIGEILTPRALLKDSPALQKLLGEAPTFIYDPANRPDPMLIPWTRARVMYAELNTIAEQAIAQKDWKMAEIAYRHMLANLNEPGVREKAEAGLEKLGQLAAQSEGGQTGIGGTFGHQAKLPTWIGQNTKAVIIDKAEPMCLVGTYILKTGDTVPRQPVEVTVVKIEPAAVHYKVMDKIFIVKVQEGE